MNIDTLKQQIRDSVLPDIDRIVESIKILVQRHKDAEKALAEGVIEVSAMRALIEQLQKEIRLTEKERAALIQQKDEVSKMVSEHKSEVDSLVRRKELLGIEIASNQDKIQKIKQLEESKQGLEKDVARLTSELIDKQEGLKEVEQNIRTSLSDYENTCKEFEAALEQTRKTNEAEMNKYRPLIDNLNEREKLIIKKEHNLAIVERRLKAFADENGLGFKL